MLGKLIKYELKATSRWFLPIYALALLLAPIERITIEAGQNLRLPLPWARIASIGFFLLTLAYVLSLIAAGVASMLLIIYRFYKNLTTNEGYLMHTLPVKTSELIWSKAAASILWSIVSSIVVCLSLVILVFNTEGFNAVMQYLPDVFSYFMKMYGSDYRIWILFVEIILLMITGSLYGIFMIYAAISIGQLFSRHRLLGSFGAYFVLTYGIQILTGVIAIPAVNSIGDSLNISGLSQNPYDQILSLMTGFAMPFLLLGTAVVAAILYYITWYIFKNKLNLE